MKRSERRLVIFDLDETLLHATERKLEEIEEISRYGEYYVYKRPYVDDLLVECSKHYALAIWSSAEDEYVHALANVVWPNSIPIEFIWGRSQCRLKILRKQMEGTEDTIFIKESHFIKPLDKLTRKGYRMKNLLIVDDSHYKVIDNPGNYYLINAFEGDPKDESLMLLKAFLKNLAEDEDFSSIQNN